MQGFKNKKGATKLEKEDLECAEAVLAKLEAGTEIRSVDTWNVKEVDFINRTQFITAKPVVYLVNMSEKDFLRKKNKHLPKVMQYVKENGGDPVIPYSAAFEERIYDLTPEEKAQVQCPTTVPASLLLFGPMPETQSYRILNTRIEGCSSYCVEISLHI